jgi:hypothetical protein
MKNTLLGAAIAAATIALVPGTGSAQHSHDVTLHLNTRWKECAFQIDPSLTQRAWHQFTSEVGMVTYFRSLNDARPLGVGNWEVSALQWETQIDDHDAAWNDTFVHPDTAHWLFEGRGLKFPGLMARVGVTKRIDVGGYVTKNPNSNYGFYGAQMQYNLLRNEQSGWATSTRVSFVSMYGPADLNVTVYGADVVSSKRYAVRWGSVSPYASISSSLSTAHEKTTAVALKDERVFGAHAAVGVAGEFSVARVGVEYSKANVQSVSLKIGVGF